MWSVQIYSFCSTHNEQFEAMGDSQETMVQRFMDTSLRYLHGASKHELYSMVIQCLEVCLCSEVWLCKKLLHNEIILPYPYISSIYDRNIWELLYIRWGGEAFTELGKEALLRWHHSAYILKSNKWKDICNWCWIIACHRTMKSCTYIHNIIPYYYTICT